MPPQPPWRYNVLSFTAEKKGERQNTINRSVARWQQRVPRGMLPRRVRQCRQPAQAGRANAHHVAAPQRKGPPAVKNSAQTNPDRYYIT